MPFNERFQIANALVSFANDQNAGKTKIQFKFAEAEEKPTELILIVPNPYVTRLEMISMMERRLSQIKDSIDYLKSQHPMEYAKGSTRLPNRDEE